MLQIFLLISIFTFFVISQTETPGTTVSTTREKTEEESCPIGWIDNGDQGCFLFSSARIPLKSDEKFMNSPYRNHLSDHTYVIP